MTASLLWLAAGLTPWALGLAGTTSGLLAYSIERHRRHRAEHRATQSKNQTVEWREEADAWRDHAQNVEAQLAAERGAHQDDLALARHHRAAARAGLRCTWGRGVTNDPRSS